MFPDECSVTWLPWMFGVVGGTGVPALGSSAVRLMKYFSSASVHSAFAVSAVTCVDVAVYWKLELNVVKSLWVRHDGSMPGVQLWTLSAPVCHCCPSKSDTSFAYSDCA